MKKKDNYNGLVKWGQEVSAGKRRVFVISTPFQSGLGSSSTTSFQRPVMGTPENTSG